MAFDPYDWYSFYFGKISRSEASDSLEEAEIGTFLLRDSSTSIGDYSLDVREQERVSHYLIQRLRMESGDTKFQIGDQTYPDVPTLLNFYKTHFMESTQLVCPAQRKLQEVIGLYDFAGGTDDNDLPFKRGDRLWILNRDEDENWWTVKNGVGKTGQIPATYVSPVDENGDPTNRASSSSNDTNSNENRDSGGDFNPPPSAPLPVPNNSTLHNGNLSPSPDGSGSERTPSPREQNKNSIQRKLPAWARVTQDRTPNAYDKTQLRLRTGERILVTKILASGTWEGEVNGKQGKFPMTYIEFLDEESEPVTNQMADLNIKK